MIVAYARVTALYSRLELLRLEQQGKASLLRATFESLETAVPRFQEHARRLAAATGAAAWCQIAEGAAVRLVSCKAGPASESSYSDRGVTVPILPSRDDG